MISPSLIFSSRMVRAKHTFRISSPEIVFGRAARITCIGAAFGMLSLIPGMAHAWVFGNGQSFTSQFSMSGNGRYVAFASNASNLVSGDTNGERDIFRLDTQTGEVVRVSVDSAGAESNGASNSPAINSDGTRVAFSSQASNLVTTDTAGQNDIFVRDLTSGTTTRVSVDSTGVEANASSGVPAISSNGARVTFQSAATNLVSGDTNGLDDIFVHDLATSTTTRVSVDSAGAQATGINGSANPSINSDGTRVAFQSLATNLVASDTNAATDVFLRDLSANTTIRVSVDSSGVQANNLSSIPSINSDGTCVAFSSLASNLVTGDTNSTFDVFVRDVVAGTTTRASVDSSGIEGNASSFNSSINSDGTRIVYESSASNLVVGDTNAFIDVFLRDVTAGTTVRASVSSAGVQGNGSSTQPSLSGDGTRVAFQSAASNLVANDTNGFADAFVRDLAGSTEVPVRLSGLSVD